MTYIGVIVTANGKIPSSSDIITAVTFIVLGTLFIGMFAAVGMYDKLNIILLIIGIGCVLTGIIALMSGRIRRKLLADSLNKNVSPKHEKELSRKREKLRTKACSHGGLKYELKNKAAIWSGAITLIITAVDIPFSLTDSDTYGFYLLPIINIAAAGCFVYVLMGGMYKKALKAYASPLGNVSEKGLSPEEAEEEFSSGKLYSFGPNIICIGKSFVLCLNEGTAVSIPRNRLVWVFIRRGMYTYCGCSMEHLYITMLTDTEDAFCILCSEEAVPLIIDELSAGSVIAGYSDALAGIYRDSSRDFSWRAMEEQLPYKYDPLIVIED